MGYSPWGPKVNCVCVCVCVCVCLCVCFLVFTVLLILFMCAFSVLVGSLTFGGKKLSILTLEGTPRQTDVSVSLMN